MPLDMPPSQPRPLTRYGRPVRDFTAADFEAAPVAEWGEYTRKIILKGSRDAYFSDHYKALTDPGTSYTTAPASVDFADGSTIRLSIETRTHYANGSSLPRPVTNWRRAVRVAVGYWRSKQAYARGIGHRAAEHLPPPQIIRATTDDGRAVNVAKANDAIKDLRG